MAYIEKYIRAGKIVSIYNLANLKGLVAMLDHSSFEEVTRMALDNPAFPFVDAEITPLVEVDVYSRVAKEMMAASQLLAKK